MCAADKDSAEFLEKPLEGRLKERLAAMEERFVELEGMIGDPDQQADGSRFQEILREHGGLSPLRQPVHARGPRLGAGRGPRHLLGDGDGTGTLSAAARTAGRAVAFTAIAAWTILTHGILRCLAHSNSLAGGPHTRAGCRRQPDSR